MSEHERIDNLREELGTEEDENLENDQETEDDQQEEEDDQPDEEDDQPDEGDDDDDDEDDDKDIPEKFKGKSKSEIIKSYGELEKSLGKRTIDKEERKDLKDAGITRKDLGDMEDIAELIKKQDFSKMDVESFAKTLLEMTDKRSDQRANAIYTQNRNVRDAVKTEVGEAQDKFPLLKSNPEFRELVLTVIEANAGKGKRTSLMEASKKISAIFKIEEEVEKKEKKPRPKVQIEKTAGAGGGKKDTEEQKVLNGILNAGGGKRTGSPLGGLGIN